jgi:formamidopyrimidine-DNA glycosylase
MPELPDVEVFRRYMNATALHQKIKNDVQSAAARLNTPKCPGARLITAPNIRRSRKI